MVAITRVLVFALLGGGAHSVAAVGFPSLINATIDEIRAGLDTGVFSSVDLVTVR